MASKRRQRRHICERKRKYDEAEARQVARQITIRTVGHKKVDAYCCPVCGSWHVGHRPYRVEKIINERRQAR